MQVSLVLQVLGEPPDHVRALSVAGAVMVITTHAAGTAYTDAGAFARDFIDGVVTHAVASSGLKSVIAAAASGTPTPPNEPLTIKYDVTDSVGNQAATGIRKVILACGTGQTLCESPATSNS